MDRDGVTYVLCQECGATTRVYANDGPLSKTEDGPPCVACMAQLTHKRPLAPTPADIRIAGIEGIESLCRQFFEVLYRGQWPRQEMPRPEPPDDYGPIC